MFRILLLVLSGFLFAPLTGHAQVPGMVEAKAEAKVRDRKPDSPENSLPRISGRTDFDGLSRIFHPNTPYAIPHVMFVVDRRQANRIFYINMKKYRFHKDFLYATGLLPLGTDMYKAVYTASDRRFIVGTLAWQKPIERWTWEVWEGDTASAEHMAVVQQAINATFFETVVYKPNSTGQVEQARAAALETVTQEDIIKGQEYLALNPGTAIGRVHIIDKLDDTVEIGSNEIIVLKELPVTLPPVAGIIVAKPSTPLSHVNILAKGWGVPNLYIKDADKLFAELNQRWIKLEATLTEYKYRFADKEVLDSYKPPEIREAPSNLKVRRITELSRMRKADSVVFGAKSANLGELLNSGIRGFSVPDGFAVPFFWYDQFVRDNKIDEVIVPLLDDLDFVHNPRYRRGKLEEIRKRFEQGKMNPGLQRVIIRKWREQLRGRPVFVRSSSNAEDLANFSGAGLYSSVANVTSEDQLIAAVQKVWGSLWRFEAYEARERNHVDHTSVHMAVLVQIGIDMDRGGVMFSRDPFDATKKDTVYISTVCGHNDQVTANGGMPEQVLVDARMRTVGVLTYSQIQSALQFQPSGGLRETPSRCADERTRRILSDDQAKKLADIAIRVRRLFGGTVDQDIEWGIINRDIFLVQSRPFFEK